MNVETERRGLRWLAGPQPFATSPVSEVLSELRRVGFARDAHGRIELTEAGRARLDELDGKRS
jgi:hypothetical protein